ncbi:alpha/beta hydrolase [Streptomyces sp. NBC_01317]|uniref:alpha/beta hydrolase n=1 Tax=Streptomyces sp. NBC_01317 TaxID=2903822 RepID=UPI002E123E74|nr:alpha/beta hydrolase [Streptomyces sp. NBC_01317]
MKPVEAVASAVLNAAALISGRLAGKGTFALFHMPLVRSELRSSERELFEKAEVSHVDVGDGKRAVTYRWGDGSRPVLLVHGWQSRASRLSAFIPGLLDSGRSVVAFDAPGHGGAGGRSTTILDYRDIVSALHDQYGTFECLIAHSMGVLGSSYGLKHGVKAQKIVTISGVCDFDYLVEEFCAELKLRDRLKARLHDEIRTNLFPDMPLEEVPYSITDITGSLRAPLLVIHDEDDTRIKVTQGRRLAAAFGEQARLVVTNGLGHRRILGDAEVVRTVLDFVAEGPGPAGGRDAHDREGLGGSASLAD